jgi:predicted SnoaL-like aldol condensation-catalyzing enzyme
MSEAAENKRIVKAFMEEMLQGKGPEVAFDTYCHPTDYKQHNPRLVNGRAGFLEFARAASLCKGFSFVVRKMAAEDDLVWLLSETTGFHWPEESDPVDPQSLRHVFFDMWRVKDGKMVEHWDIYQQVPSYTANGNDMI